MDGVEKALTISRSLIPVLRTPQPPPFLSAGFGRESLSGAGGLAETVINLRKKVPLPVPRPFPFPPRRAPHTKYSYSRAGPVSVQRRQQQYLFIFPALPYTESVFVPVSLLSHGELHATERRERGCGTISTSITKAFPFHVCVYTCPLTPHTSPRRPRLVVTACARPHLFMRP